MTRSRTLLAGVATAALALPLAGAWAQDGLPQGHPPLPPGGAAAPTTAPTPEGAALPQGHPPVEEGREAPTAEALLQQLDATPGLKERDKTFEMAAMIGRLYLHNGRTKDAQDYLAQAEAKAEGVRALLRAELPRLSAAEQKKATAEACTLPAEAPLDAREREARSRLEAGDRPGAVACARSAAQALVGVLALQGHAAFLSGDADRALAVHERALALEPLAEESLFARASLLYETRGDDVKALKQAREDFARFLKAWPQSPRAPLARALEEACQEALAAGGVSKRTAQRVVARRERVAKEIPQAGALASAPPQAPAQPPPSAGGEPVALTKEMVEAVKSVERTPEFEAGLAKLVDEGEEHLAHGRYEDALAAYRRVVPFLPESGRAKAGMAWALVALKRQPMADRVWGVAVQSDPAAVDALGDTLKARGDSAGAKAVWGRLAQTDPAYAKRSALEGKMR